jgi:hypothetical protein
MFKSAMFGVAAIALVGCGQGSGDRRSGDASSQGTDIRHRGGSTATSGSSTPAAAPASAAPAPTDPSGTSASTVDSSAAGSSTATGTATADSTPPASSINIVKVDDHTFEAQPHVSNTLTTIDGYLFIGMPYYDESPAIDSAVELWWKLAADPNYVPLPPITSVGVDTTVGGTVGP